MLAIITFPSLEAEEKNLKKKKDEIHSPFHEKSPELWKRDSLLILYQFPTPHSYFLGIFSLQTHFKSYLFQEAFPDVLPPLIYIFAVFQISNEAVLLLNMSVPAF